MKGSAKAFRKWRGKKPVSVHVFDIEGWEYEDRDMRKAWDAGVKWAQSHIETHGRAGQ